MKESENRGPPTPNAPGTGWKPARYPTTCAPGLKLIGTISRLHERNERANRPETLDGTPASPARHRAATGPPAAARRGRLRGGKADPHADLPAEGPRLRAA